MAAPAQFQSRILVRAEPFSAQKTFVNQAVANAGTLFGVFDVSLIVCDSNQLQAGVVNSLPTVGPFLDAYVFSDQIGTVDVLVAVDAGATLRSILPAPLALAASIAVQINGLRVPGRYIEVLYTNTSGNPATTDFGAYVRSN